MRALPVGVGASDSPDAGPWWLVGLAGRWPTQRSHDRESAQDAGVLLDVAAAAEGAQPALEGRGRVGAGGGEERHDVLADLEGLKGPAVVGEAREDRDEHPLPRLLDGPSEVHPLAPGLAGEQTHRVPGAVEEAVPGLLGAEPADQQHRPTLSTPGVSTGREW